jgi:TPP-dependent pyruvate/acetoin dehydrogenase alpha subunit
MMTDPILLTAAEIAAVSGGAIAQSISISVTQRNTSSVSQSATAINSGRVTATATGTGATAAAAGAEATNIALVSQINVVAAVNNLQFGRY